MMGFNVWYSWRKSRVMKAAGSDDRVIAPPKLCAMEKPELCSSYMQ